MEYTRLDSDIKRLEESLGQLPEPVVKPAFIVVSGLPGTGKSHLSIELARRLPFTIVESDALRKQLFPTPTYSGEESGYLFKTIYQMIEDLLKGGIPVILDATNLEERGRERLYNIAEKTDARLILVSVKAPPELVEKRLSKRTTSKNTNDNSDADWAVYQKMEATAENIKRNHFVVDTSRDITPVIDKVVRETKR